ncbi:MAG TPA: hypothetical protein VM222_07005, partial [Planctomycetota bacterium]|nr:hypothetical protein [Planctomycetota bacterium]
RVSGKGRLQGCDGAQVDFQAQGSQWLTLDTGRILKMSMDGTFDISGELAQNGRTIKWGGRMVAKGEAVKKYE